MYMCTTGEWKRFHIFQTVKYCFGKSVQWVCVCVWERKYSAVVVSMCSQHVVILDGIAECKYVYLVLWLPVQLDDI